MLNNLSQNRRRSPRLSLQMPVTLIHNRKKHQAFTYDISSAGISIYSQKLLKLFVIYQIKLELPEDTARNIPGRTLDFETVVVRCAKWFGGGLEHGYRISMFMFFIGDEEKKFLIDFINHRINTSVYDEQKMSARVKVRANITQSIAHRKIHNPHKRYHPIPV